MQTDSSARRTCMASASAVECTATVRMPISWQARWMRSAISPRLAISTFSNMPARPRPLFDDEQRFAVFDGCPGADQDARDTAGARRDDGIEDLHGLDQQQRLAAVDLVADLDE